MKTLDSPGVLVAMRNRLALVTPDDTRRWGRMTPHQMICHLGDAFAFPLGTRPATPIRISALPVPLLKWLALRLPRNWPPNVPSVPEMNQQIGGTRPYNFEEDRDVLLDRIEQFVSRVAPWPPHPIFRRMSRAEWMRWGYLHTDHHLRQFGR